MAGKAITDERSPPALWSFKTDYKVLRGKNGRLFLDGDSAGVLRQHTGELPLTPRQLGHWQRLLEQRAAWLDAHGAQYLFAIVPNAHSVYPEDLPDGIAAAAERPVHQLMRHLDDHAPALRVAYPVEECIAEKGRWPIYSRTDTHWSAFGAYVHYRSMLKELSRTLAVEPLAERDVRFRIDDEVGDLGYKLDPRESSTNAWASVAEPQAFLVSDNRVVNQGALIVTHCDEAPPLRCLVFGDSSTVQMLPLLAATFRRFTFAHLLSLDRGLAEHERPDVVIGLQSERLLPRPPSDEGAPTLAEHARRKLAKGIVRRQIPIWPRAEGSP